MRRVLMDNRRHGWQEAIANDLRGETGRALSALKLPAEEAGTLMLRLRLTRRFELLHQTMLRLRLTRRFELQHQIGEAKVRYRRISVRQEHIDEGVQADCNLCPISLAIYEEFFDEDGPEPLVSVGKQQARATITCRPYEITYPLMDIINNYDKHDIAMVPMELMLLEHPVLRVGEGAFGWLT